MGSRRLLPQRVHPTRFNASGFRCPLATVMTARFCFMATPLFPLFAGVVLNDAPKEADDDCGN